VTSGEAHIFRESLGKMSKSCVLVETGDEEPIVAVAGLIGTLIHGADEHTELAKSPAKKYAADVASMLESGAAGKVIGKLLQDGKGKLFGEGGRGSEKDIEATVVIMCNLADKLPAQESKESYALLVAAAESSTTDKPELRARMLFQMYNSITSETAKVGVFSKILAYVKAAGLSDLVPGLVKHVEENCKDWELSAEETRKMYYTCAGLLESIDKKAKVLEFHLKYLATVKEGDKTGAECEEVAKKACTAFLASPDVMQVDLLEYAGVRALEKGSADAKAIFQLLSTLLKGTIAEYEAFVKSNPKALTAVGLSADLGMTKMRLMALAAIAEKATGSGEIAYATFKDALKVSASEVEEWIVKAIGAKLIDAKMDQVREVVTVTRCAHRVFGKEQWSDLRVKLAAWRDNLTGVKGMAKAAATGQMADPAAVLAH